MKLKILIVEDDDIAQIYLKEIVESFSREILMADNGIQGLKYFRDHQDIDLILMDIKLPDLNGYEVTKQIRLYNKKIIIIAQTAYAMSLDRKKALDAGCNDYVSKPVTQNLLLQTINKYLHIN
ncbi:MAG TPA: response regulator [Flavobacteriaceae bacterium]|nr:response regulator [Flavobacteriaceae bacterium]HEX5742826.1 response regulator [Flavobacteriaceae bacterium]